MTRGLDPFSPSGLLFITKLSCVGARPLTQLHHGQKCLVFRSLQLALRTGSYHAFSLAKFLVETSALRTEIHMPEPYPCSGNLTQRRKDAEAQRGKTNSHPAKSITVW